MNWAIWLVFGIAAAVFILSAAIAGQSPAFWWGLGKMALGELAPVLAKVVKRMSPEDEKRWRDCVNRGGRWDNQKKRCLEPR